MYSATVNQKSLLLTLFELVHASLWSVSIGQAWFAEYFIAIYEVASISAVNTNIISLWEVSQIIWGKLAVKLAKLEPSPKETKVTGRAQQSSVLVDPNKDKKDINLFTY